MLYYARDAVRDASTFLGGVAFRAFFLARKWRVVAYGGLAFLFLVMAWNVWTTLSLARTMNVVGDMFQHGAKDGEFTPHLWWFVFYGFSYFVTETAIEQYQLRYNWYWRETITRALAARWIESQCSIEGASERIHDCPRDLAQKIVDLSVPFVRSIMILLVFVPTLWNLNEEFPVIRHVPGGLFWLVALWCMGQGLGSFLIGIRLPGLRFRLHRNEARMRTGFQDIEHGKKARARVHMKEIDVRLWSLDDRLLRLRRRYARTFYELFFFGLWKNAYRQVWGFGTMIVGISLVARNVITAGVFLETTNVLNETHRAFSVLSDSWGIITEIWTVMQRIRQFETLMTEDTAVTYVEYDG